MPKSKRPILEGDDDGEHYPWKVVKSTGGKAHVFYGEGGHDMFKLSKKDQKNTPTQELVLQRIREHRQQKRLRDRQQDDEEGGGGKKAKGTRLAAEAAAVTSGAESSMSPSGSKEDRRVQTPFPHLSTPGEPGHDYDAERRSAAENREHRRIVNDFRWVYIDAATAMVEVIPVVKCRARHAATFIAPKAKATYALPWRGLKSASEGAKWHFSRLCGILCSKKIPADAGPPPHFKKKVHFVTKRVRIWAFLAKLSSQPSLRALCALNEARKGEHAFFQVNKKWCCRKCRLAHTVLRSGGLAGVGSDAKNAAGLGF